MATKTAELLSKTRMRILNILALVIITIAWVVRFYYFMPQDDTILNSDGTVSHVEVHDEFWLIIYTTVVLPILIGIFVIVEMQVKHEKLAPFCKHFFFLDYYLGKGLYLLLIVSIIL